MTFGEFITAYKDGSIFKDVGWRAYNIEGSVKPKFVLDALKYLGYAYAGEHALSTIAGIYSLDTADEARTLLGYWWAFKRVDEHIGRRVIPFRPKA